MANGDVIADCDLFFEVEEARVVEAAVVTNGEALGNGAAPDERRMAPEDRRLADSNSGGTQGERSQTTCDERRYASEEEVIREEAKVAAAEALARCERGRARLAPRVVV
jgi:hypothetical protein